MTDDKAILELQQGDLFLKEGKLEKAIACYRRAITLNPKLTQAQQRLAALLKQQENSQATRRAISLSKQKQLSITKHHHQEVARIYLQQAKLFSQGKQWQEAIQACHECLQLTPKNSEAYKTWANILQTMGKPTEAIGYYAKALTFKLDDPEVYINLGGLFFQQQQWQQAINYYQKAIAINPKAAVAYRNLARSYQKTGKSKLMLQCWEKALSLEPASAKAPEHCSLGKTETLFKQGNVERAIACYRRAIFF